LPSLSTGGRQGKDRVAVESNGRSVLEGDRNIDMSSLNTIRERAAIDLELQLGGQLLLFLLADFALVCWSLFRVLVDGATPRLVFTFSVALPLVLLGPAACCTLFALERKAGNIELAVSLPRPWKLFERRASWVLGGLALQGFALLLTSWSLEGFSYPLLPAGLQILALASLVATTSLAWAATFTAPSVVFLGTLTTLLLLWPWTFYLPIQPRYSRLPQAFLPEAQDWPGLLAVIFFMLALAVLQTIYLRRRLASPLNLLS